MGLSSLFIISCIQMAAVGAVVLIQNPTLTKSEKKTAFISCEVTGLSTSYVHWYQKKEDVALRRILYMDGSGKVTKDVGFQDFNGEKRGENYRLHIPAVKSHHSATYYCAAWEDSSGNWFKVFGSGTQLIVTDAESKPPTVTTYISSNLAENNKAALLCVATEMYPNVVRFIWEKRDSRGTWENVPPGEMNVLQQEEESRTSSIMITDKNKVDENAYSCSVQHEKTPSPTRNVVQKKAPSDKSKEDDSKAPEPNCEPNQGALQSNASDVFPGIHSFKNMNELTSLNMVTLSYSVMILKSMMYFGVVSVIMYKRSGRSFC